jgi:uncharacterized protein YqjF (DUF2071 family)
MSKVFLSAEWRKLAMANYVVDEKILIPFLPAKTVIDTWKNRCYVSLVGFMFVNTKVKGFKVPLHINFEEVNLRFYVRYNDNGNWKRGVVFIKEIVPRPALTFIANTIYNENYETMRMSHSWNDTEDYLHVEYKWKKNSWNSFSLKAKNIPSEIETGSEEEFITEHYFGYTKLNNLETSEYGVEHPRWDVYKVKDFSIDVDFENVYGKSFEFLKTEKPISVFLAEGSEIKVMDGRKLR